jgi:hypothetical protein
VAPRDSGDSICAIWRIAANRGRFADPAVDQPFAVVGLDQRVTFLTGK